MSPDSIGTQIRRRREAADRSESMSDGHRDPLDREPSTAVESSSSGGRQYKPASVITDTPYRIAAVKGHQVAAVLRREGMKPIYSESAGGWVLDLERVPDVVAILEWANYSVRCRERVR